MITPQAVQRRVSKNLNAALRAAERRANSAECPTSSRLSENAGILASGLIRLQVRQSSRFLADNGESSLDCPAHQSIHARVAGGNGETR